MTQPRKYEQKERAASASRTRQRILDAVHERLSAFPSEPVSIDVVAKTAGVTRPTIYTTFGSRAGLFAAAGNDLLLRAGFGEVLEGVAHPDALEGLRAGFRGIARTYAHDREVFRALFSMAQLDPASFGGAIGRLEEGRAFGMTDLAQRLDEQQRLQDDMNVEAAAHALWLLTSFESFDLLHTARGLSAAATAQHLTQMAERSLLQGP